MTLENLSSTELANANQQRLTRCNFFLSEIFTKKRKNVGSAGIPLDQSYVHEFIRILTPDNFVVSGRTFNQLDNFLCDKLLCNLVNFVVSSFLIL